MHSSLQYSLHHVQVAYIWVMISLQLKKSIDIAFLTMIERCIAKNGNYFQPSKKSDSHGSIICTLLQYALNIRERHA